MFLKLSPICDTLNKTLRKNLKRMSDFYSKDETKVLKTLMTFFSLWKYFHSIKIWETKFNLFEEVWDEDGVIHSNFKLCLEVES